MREALGALLAVLLLFGAAIAQEYPFKKNPSELNVRGNYVQHSWSGGKLWISGTDAKNFLGYGSGRELRVDLVEAMAAKGWTYQLDGGLLKVNKTTSATRSDSEYPTVAAIDGVTDDVFMIKWHPKAQEFFFGTYGDGVVNLFPVSRDELDDFAAAYQDAAYTAVRTDPGQDRVTWRKQSENGHNTAQMEAVYVSGGTGLRAVFLKIKSGTNRPTIFAIPITWPISSASYSDYERVKAEFEGALVRARQYRP